MFEVRGLCSRLMFEAHVRGSCSRLMFEAHARALDLSPFTYAVHQSRYNLSAIHKSRRRSQTCRLANGVTRLVNGGAIGERRDFVGGVEQLYTPYTKQSYC